jgi:DNA-binding XRE family transcriptional regulator
MTNNLKEIREENGMTLEKLAQLSEVSTGYLCHLEKGSRKNPSWKVANNIAKALNKVTDDIFENKQT